MSYCSATSKVVLPKNAAQLMEEHFTNEVFKMGNTKKTHLNGFLRRLVLHGHLVRNGGITFDLMLGQKHGTSPRGRQITT